MTRDPRPILARASMTQEAAARLLGVDERTMRRWCQEPAAPGYRAMQEPAWRLLALIADLPGVAARLERIAGRRGS